MDDEEIVNIETPPETPDTDDTKEILDQIDDTAEDIDELTEQLTVHAILSEERHGEILEGVDECLTEVKKLSAAGQTAENPLLTQILNQLIEMRVELTSLKSSTDILLTSREQKSSTRKEETPPMEDPNQDAPKTGASTDAPSEAGARKARPNRVV